MAKSRSTDSGDPRVVKPDTVADLKRHLKTAVRARVRPILWGPPGVGKSAVVNATAAELSADLPKAAEVYTLIGSLCEPTDVTGFPVVSGTVELGGRELPVLKFAPRDWAVRLAANGGVLFIDELTTCSGAVMAALLRVMTDLVVGDVQLPAESTAVIAAANWADQAANGTELPPPMANRLCHVQFPTGVQAAREWAAAFPGYWGHPPALSFAGRTVAPELFARARAYVAGFVHHNGAKVWLDFPEDPDRQTLAWPSPRAWENVARTVAVTLDEGGKPADAGFLSAGLVGGGAAAAFLDFLRVSDFPDPDALLAKPESYRPTGRPDVDYAVLQSVVSAADAHRHPGAACAAGRVLEVALAAGGKSLEAASPAAGALTEVVGRWVKAGLQCDQGAFVPMIRSLQPFTQATQRLKTVLAAEGALGKKKP